MLGLRIQVHLKIADSVAAVRQESDFLVHLHSLRFEHLEQTAFGFSVVAIYKSEAFRRFAVLGHTLTHDHLEPSFRSRLLVFCMDITTVDSNDQRCGRIRKLIPVSLAATSKHVLLFSQFVFKPLGRSAYPLPDCCRAQLLADRQHLLQELDCEPVRNKSRKLGLQIYQLWRTALLQQLS